MTDVLGLACSWIASGGRIAMATVVKTWGSAPVPAGSRLLVHEDGRFAGSVSGGCLENEVILAAQEAIAARRRRLLEFGVPDGRAWQVGLACGGRMRILVDPILDPAALRVLIDAQAARRVAVLALDLEAGADVLFPLEAEGDLSPLMRAARAAARADAPAEIAVAGRDVLFSVFAPPLELAIVGAVHIAQALAPMAGLAGYRVSVVDPRPAFATAARFPDVRLIQAWPDEALNASPPHARTAVIALSHDPKLDDAALVRALSSPAFYVGCLGSQKTQDARIDRLKRAGMTDAQIARLRGPVGLDIGARTPAEIAVAILAEMTAVLRGRHATGMDRRVRAQPA